jgi:hypothetical protein
VLLTFVGSSNFGRIHVESVVSVYISELTESLIGRILCEGALSPHRGSRRCMPCCPMSIKLLKLMFFIFSVMRMRMRRVRMLRRLLNDFLLLSHVLLLICRRRRALMRVRLLVEDLLEA